MKIISGDEFMTSGSAKTISHENVDVSKSYIIITGTGLNSSNDRAVQPWVSDRKSNQFKVVNSSGTGVSLNFSYQIISFE